MALSPEEKARREEERASLARARLEARARELAAQAPPLTEAQIEAAARILSQVAWQKETEDGPKS